MALPPFNRSCGTDFIAIPTMQAVFLLYDYGLCRNINALLRTFGITQLAANTFVRHKIAGFFCLCAAEEEAGPFNRKFGEVKPFSGSFVNFEYCKRAAGTHIGINLLHIGIFTEQVGQHVRPDLLRLTAARRNFHKKTRKYRPAHDVRGAAAADRSGPCFVCSRCVKSAR